MHECSMTPLTSVFIRGLVYLQISGALSFIRILNYADNISSLEFSSSSLFLFHDILTLYGEVTICMTPMQNPL